jgi:hypothetical protein
MSERIRIERDELADPHVDERLKEQQSFGFGPSSAPEPPARLLFKPWFALMLAGAIGALVAWAIVEPWLDDGIRVSGVIRSIHPSLTEGFRVLDVSGVEVRLPAEVRIVTKTGQEGGLGDLAVGDAVDVLANAYAGDQVVLGHFVKQKTRIGTADPNLNLRSIRLRDQLAGLALFPMTAAFIGLFVGAADGFLSKAWSRSALGGAVGFVVGLFAGLAMSIPAGMVFQFGAGMARAAQPEPSRRLTGGALLLFVMGRGLAWAIIGATAGMGLGIASRSRKLFVNGIVGGSVGALLGGVLFDPIDRLFEHVLRTGGAELSRAVGLVLIGAVAGAMIGVVELIARESWIRILTGPIAGKEFILYRNPTWIGSSPKSEIFLFKDPQVAPRHAAIHRVADWYEIEDQGSPAGTLVGPVRIKRQRLRDRDRVQLGQTTVEFRVRDE